MRASGLKYLLIFPFIIFIMGNKNCNNQPQPTEERYLKVSIDAGALRAKSFLLPNNERADFQTYTTTEFFYALARSPYFTIDSESPNQSRLMEIQQDQKIIAEYGFNPELLNLSSEQDKDPLRCLRRSSQMNLNGDALSFEVSSSGGFKIGFTPGGEYSPIPVSAYVQFVHSLFTLALKADDPLTNKILIQTEAESKEDKIAFGFEFGSFVGLSFFYKTRIHTFVSQALDKVISNLVYQIKIRQSQKMSWRDVWQSVVIADPELVDGDTHILIKDGLRHDLKVGDRFQIFNMKYSWVGEPCNSTLEYSSPTSIKPLALVEVVNVANDVSVARVLEHYRDENIEAGALVKISSLIDP